jgi:carboxylesterase
MGKKYMPGAEPFLIKKGPVGCLLIHGFTGATHEMKELGEYLAERDITVMGPCLAGHGTRVEDLNETRWPDWYVSARTALDELKGMCETVFVGGLSMGGLQTLHLATHDRDVRGFMCYAAPVYVRNWKLQLFEPIMRNTPIMKVYRYDKGIAEDIKNQEAIKTHVSYKKTPTACVLSLVDYMNHVKADLGEIKAPIILFQAREDHTVHPGNADVIFKGVGSKDKEVVWLDNSYHVLPVDNDKQTVFEKSYEFIQKHL